MKLNIAENNAGLNVTRDGNANFSLIALCLCVGNWISKQGSLTESVSSRYLNCARFFLTDERLGLHKGKFSLLLVR